MSLPTNIADPLPQIERALSQVLSRQPVPTLLGDAMAYALLAPGKRIRPLLAWHCCIAVGGAGPLSLAAGTAVELVHAFSLVHDDLPAMDDDDERRGRPTLHIAKGEAMAILAGDALLALAFGSLTDGRVEPGLAAALCRELFEGTRGMITGQVFDTLGGLPDRADPREQVGLIHASKTGALITASCRMGALCGFGAESPANASELFEAVTRYGQHIGLMFQIVDDLLDVTQSRETTGKRTGKDAAAGKRTFPGVIGVEAARLEVQRLRDGAMAALTPLGPAAEPLRGLAEWLAVRTR